MTEATQKLVIKMAKYYISTKKATFKMVSEKFEIPYSTANKYLNISLKDISYELWSKVQLKKAENIFRSRQNFCKPKKCGFLGLFKK